MGEVPIENWAHVNGQTKADEDEMLESSKGLFACWSRSSRGHNQNFVVGFT
jgi:hypothetical protein